MMLSVPKSKSKDQKAAKEQKTPLKSTAVLNGGNGLPASAYNPLLGTFHTLDTSSTTSPQVLHGNGRFGNIDDSENHNGSTHGSGGDCDSASNNDARSVESEDQNKEKSNAPNKLGLVPGADNDKREKIRQKNERKHQRQKEKRAQELHERCNGYLMSRKLESLAQQLVGMGFSHERATMALILNEGRVEEAVAWLFEGGEESDTHKDQSLDSGNNLKIDISDEIARIAEMEIKFKCSKQDVERAIVSCEGDLEKAEEALRSQKPDQSAAQPKPEENVRLIQPKPNSVPLILQRRDDKDVTNTKFPALVGLAPKSLSKAVLPVTRSQSKLEWARPPSASHSLAPPLQVSPPPLKDESCYVQPGPMREPVLMMQRIQSVNTKPPPVTSINSSPPGGAVSWYPSGSDVMKSNEFSPHIPSTRSPSPNNPYYQPAQSQQQHQAFMLGSSSQMDNSLSSRVNEPFLRMGASSTQPLNPGSGPMTNRVNDPFSRSGPSSTISAASSQGLYSGLGSTYSPELVSPVDWNTSSSMQPCDYTSIDWSLDKSYLSTKPSGFWLSVGPYSRINHSGGVSLAMRPSSSNGNDGINMGLQEGGATTADSSAAGSHEWTSPFQGKDIFSLPRQFVFSPSL